MNEKTFVSLFSGCGGLDLGFINAGFKCVGAFDKDKKAIEVHEKNITCKIAQVADLSLEETDLLIPQANVLIAGPPCQGFSTAGKMKDNDARNSLLQVAVRIAKKIKPSVIVIENVPGLKSDRMKRHYDGLIESLKKNRYKTKTVICDPFDCGVPQHRKRVFIIAWNDKLPFIDNIPLSNTKKKATVNDALAGINASDTNHKPKMLLSSTDDYIIASRIKAGQKLCDVRGGSNAVHTWDIPEVFGKTSKKEKEILELVRSLRRRERRRENGDSDPVSIQRIKHETAFSPDAHINTLIKKGYLRKKGRYIDLAHAFNGWYRRLDGNSFSPTVDTHFGRPKYFLHPTENRGLTVREAARLQTFPDTFNFEGTEAEQYRMIGNAVPPKMAQAIASYIGHILHSS